MLRRLLVGSAVLSLVPGFAALPAALAASAPVPMCAGLPATIVGTDGPDSLEGTDGADVVALGAGGDEFFGHDGDDVICGGPGGDDLSGMGGADRISGGGGPDEIHQDGPDELIHGGSDDDVIHTGSTQPPNWTGTLVGGSGFDLFRFGGATPGGLVVDVSAGTVRGAGSFDIDDFEAYSLTSEHDVFRGGPGRDEIYGIEGGDELSMGAGTDVVLITALSRSGSTVRMGPGNDRATVAAGGRHRLWLGRGDDSARVAARIEVRAGPGNDHIRPLGHGGKIWSVRGESGRDILDLSQMQRAVRLDASAGTVTLRNGNVHRFSGFERYRGTTRGDTLLGSDGPDRVYGDDGADRIRGRAGDDALFGNGGADVIRGNAGRDVCSRGNTRGCERLRADRVR